MKKIKRAGSFRDCPDYGTTRAGNCSALRRIRHGPVGSEGGRTVSDLLDLIVSRSICMIYILEDDDSIRKLVTYALESQGFEAE